MTKRCSYRSNSTHRVVVDEHNDGVSAPRIVIVHVLVCLAGHILEVGVSIIPLPGAVGTCLVNGYSPAHVVGAAAISVVDEEPATNGAVTFDSGNEKMGI